jgi:dCMP deaminase
MHTHKWERRFLELAQLVSTWSKDPSTQVGAVLVGPDKRVLSVGFNGFPASVPDEPEDYAERATKYARIVHAEMNALLFAPPHLIRGSTLYTYPFGSCSRCAAMLVQAGVEEFVSPYCPPALQERWQQELDTAHALIEDAGAAWFEISVP